MATNWESYPIEVSGGLVTNLPPIQHGIKLPGSARRLINFEPSVEGGYRRINGYSKYDDETVPMFGGARVQASGQTGTSLNIANIFESPTAGDTFTIAGITGTYTISAVTFNPTNHTAALTLGSSLASSPADGAALTFTENGRYLIRGLTYFNDNVVVARNGCVYKGSGTGWTQVNTPSYGTVLTVGLKSSGLSTLDLDGLTAEPGVGDTFTLDGVELTYTIATVTSYSATAGTATISFTPALAANTPDNTAVTFLQTDFSSTLKVDHADLNFLPSNSIVFVNGNSKISFYDGTSWLPVNNPGETDAAVVSPEFVEVYKSSVFYANDNSVAFTAPNTYDDFSAANGGGIIEFPERITAMKTFRDQLIVFSKNSITRIVGSSSADYQILPITRNIGCVGKHSVQEVGGDLLFLANDGLRFLGATDRIGDFSIAQASKQIQPDMTSFIDSYTEFEAVTIREKSQYRIFGYNSSLTQVNAPGFIGTQTLENELGDLSFSETRKIFVYVAHSEFSEADESFEEVIHFANKDGYVYIMDVTDQFDGTDIVAEYWTPYLSINDPRVRKTIYKVTTYLEPEGSLEGRFQLEFDFNKPGTVQPSPIAFDAVVDAGSTYGTGVYGTMTYGEKVLNEYIKQTTGSGFNVSVKYTFISGRPFSVDVIHMDYMTYDKQ